MTRQRISLRTELPLLAWLVLALPAYPGRRHSPAVLACRHTGADRAD